MLNAKVRFVDVSCALCVSEGKERSIEETRLKIHG